MCQYHEIDWFVQNNFLKVSVYDYEDGTEIGSWRLTRCCQVVITTQTITYPLIVIMVGFQGPMYKDTVGTYTSP